MTNLKKTTSAKTYVFACILTWFFTFIANTAQSIELQFESLETQPDMPGHVILDITQDRDGFLWFATYNGLVKYSGKDIQSFQSNSGNSNVQLPSDWVTHISPATPKTSDIDIKGPSLLWVGTDVGLFTMSESFNLNPIIKDIWVRHVMEDDKITWVGTQNGVIILDENNHPIKHLLRDLVVRHLSHDNTTIYASTASGLYSIDKHSHATNKLSDYSTWQTALSIDSDAGTTSIWMATEDGLIVNDAGQDSIMLDQQFVRSISKDPNFSINGILWLGTDRQAVWEYDTIKQTIHKHGLNADHPNFSITNPTVFKLFHDDAFVLWVGTQAGVNKALTVPFKHILHKSSDDNFLPHHTISSFHIARDGSSWYGTNGGGIVHVSADNQILGHYKKHADNKSFQLSDNRVTSLIEDRTGKIWAGGYRGVDIIDTKSGAIYSIDRWIPKLKNQFINTLYEDSQGGIWIGTDKLGAYRFDYETKIDEHLPGVSAFEKSLLSDENNQVFQTVSRLPHQRVLRFLERTPGQVWIGTWSGLALYHTNQQKLQQLSTPKSSASNRDIIVRDIIQLDQNQLYVATRNKGLYHLQFNKASNNKTLDQQTELALKNYGEQHGLKNHDIRTMIKDSKNQLWLGTASGIANFQPKKEQFNHYQSTDGVLVQTFAINGRYQSEQGELFFSGVNGVVHFHPDNVLPSQYTPNVKIYRTPNDSIGNPSDQNTFDYAKPLNFSFSSLDFSAPGRNQYAYRLLGLNDRWQMIGYRNAITFNSLSPGSYTLQVKGTNRDGVWSEKVDQYTFSVKAPFWKTNWAYAFYAILIAFIAEITRRSYRAKINRSLEQANQANLIAMQREKLAKHEQARRLQVEQITQQQSALNALKDQLLSHGSHDVRTPLQTIIGGLDCVLMKKRTHDLDPSDKQFLEQAKKSGYLIHRMLKNLTLYSKLQSERAEQLAIKATQPTTPDKPLATGNSIGLILHNARQSNDFKQLTIDETIVTPLPKIALKHPALEIIIHQLFENVIQHSEVLTAKLNLFSADDHLIIECADLGAGINQAIVRDLGAPFLQGSGKNGLGLGFSIISTILDGVDGSIEIEANSPKGTKVIIRVPSIKISGKNADADKAAKEQLVVS